MGIRERKERDFKRREVQILAAAREMFRYRDIESITVSEIARKAEIGKGTVYKHFSSKEEIVGRILLDVQRDFFWLIKKELPPEAKPLEMMQQVIGTSFRFHLKNPKFHIRLHQYCERENFMDKIGGELRRELMAVEESIFDVYRAQINRGIKEGYFDDGPIDYFLFSVGSAIQGSIRMAMAATHHHQELFLSEQYHQHLARFLIKGMGWTEEKDAALNP